MLATEVPYTLYFDKAGKPLDGGSIYFGVANQNPETNPQTVYWDVAGTQPVAQPVPTIAGYPVRNGTIAQIYSPTDYSVTVRDKDGQLVRYEASSANFSAASQTAALISSLFSSAGAAIVGWIQSGANAIARFVVDKLREQRSVFDYMTQAQIADVSSGTGSLDVTAALQTALTANSTRRLLWPDGKYKISSTAGNDALTVPRYCHLEFQSQFGTVIDATGVAAGQAALYIFGNQFNLSRPKIIGSGTQIGVRVKNGYIARYEDGYMVNLAIGLSLDEAGSCVVTNWNFENCAVGSQAAGGSAYHYQDCDFNTGTTVGVLSAISVISGAGSSVTTENCRFACSIGAKMPANSTLSYYSKNDYAEGTNTLTCQPYAIGTTGTGTIMQVTIENAQVANAFNSGSVFANIQYMRRGGNYWGQPCTVNSTVQNIMQVGPDWWFLAAYDVNNSPNQISISSSTGAFGATKFLTTGLDNATTAGQVRYALQSAAQGFDLLSDRLRPIVDNAMHFGDTTHRCIDLYAVNATVQTSDEREKTDIAGIPAPWLVAWRQVEWLSFRRLDEPVDYAHRGKLHVGVVAQRVRDAFAAQGIDAAEIGLLTYDQWQDEIRGPVVHEVKDADGEVIGTETREEVIGYGAPRDRWGVRYEEALALECALMRSRLDAMEARL